MMPLVPALMGSTAFGSAAIIYQCMLGNHTWVRAFHVDSTIQTTGGWKTTGHWTEQCHVCKEWR